MTQVSSLAIVHPTADLLDRLPQEHHVAIEGPLDRGVAIDEFVARIPRALLRVDALVVDTDHRDLLCRGRVLRDALDVTTGQLAPDAEEDDRSGQDQAEGHIDHDDAVRRAQDVALFGIAIRHALDTEPGHQTAPRKRITPTAARTIRNPVLTIPARSRLYAWICSSCFAGIPRSGSRSARSFSSAARVSARSSPSVSKT